MSSSRADACEEGSVLLIVPTLRATRYLNEAISSVLNDDLAPASLEVVVVFDGAMPQDLPVWEADDRVRVIATGRQAGSGAASNDAAATSNAEFIARMDADDLTHPGRLATQVRYLRENPDVVLVGTSGAMIDASGEVLGDYPTGFGSDVRRSLLRRNPIIHSSIVMRRSAFDSVGGYDPACIRMQDYDLVLRLAQMGRISVLPQRLILYRIHGEQTSKKPANFIGLMRKISRLRRVLARQLGVPLLAQVPLDIAFVAAQMLRYSGVRKPRYSAELAKTTGAKS